ncbi:MAG: AP protein [Verrucomicrobia bacterium]|nr:AP protein [Verrucomicrobiota bacterium]
MALFLCMTCVPGTRAAVARNVILVTTDGLRWEEMFRGAEATLMTKTNGGVKDTNGLNTRFWRETEIQRREALLPFVWSVMAKQGQIIGNKDKGNRIKVTNGRNFSFPGYSEFLTGAEDPRIISNAYLPNPNTNVFEWLNTQPGFHGRVSAIVNWDVIAWVLNVGRSRIPVWTGLRLPENAPPPPSIPAWIPDALAGATPLWKDVIPDTFTAEAALHHIREARPRAVYFAFGETDEWAHDGRYDLYLSAAYNVDRFLSRLWTLVQSLPEYRDQTALVFTTDHGRGLSPEKWKNHGAETEESGWIWAAMLGVGVKPLGERVGGEEMMQGQTAATVAALVGMDFKAASSRAAPAFPY